MVNLKTKVQDAENVKLQQEREVQSFQQEVPRQLGLLRSEMVEAVKDAAHKAYPGREFVKISQEGEEKLKADEGKLWAVQQAYQVRQKGTILGMDYFVIVKCSAALQFDAFSKQFRRNIAKTAIVRSGLISVKTHPS